MTAYVYHNKIQFVANRPPEGEKDTEVAVYSNNSDPTGYDSSNPDEWQTGKHPSVTLDHKVNVDLDSPLVFTNLVEQIPYQPQGGGPPYPTPKFTFEYTIPLFTANAQDPPWVFTKTGRSGGVKDWDTPLKDPKPFGDDDPDPEDGGMDSNLIMLAVILMVVAAVGVRM